MSDLVQFSIGVLVLLVMAFFIVWIPLSKRYARQGIMLFVTIGIASVGLYWHWGAPKGLLNSFQKKRDAQIAKQYLATHNDPDEVVRNLEKLLAEQPSRPKGWFLLGNIYAGRGDAKKAIAAYQKAHAQNRDEVSYLLALAKAQLEFDGVMQAEVYQSLVMHSQSQPKVLLIFHLMALNEYAGKRYKQAIAHWKYVLGRLPAESPDAASVLKRIGQAQRALKK